ncbi:MAG: hypothetical protein PHI97_06115 [Desulfobulbus sp.]|nr:hypothetical protein [Desulfobulbus sp.]
MELSQLFTELVVLVCAIHLAGVVGRSVGTFSAKSVLDDQARQPGHRSDWYCFFSCSALTGSESVPRNAVKDDIQTPQAVYANRQSKRRSRASMSC